MATAIGGRIRWEISQNAMSRLASDRRNRRPTVWARMTKIAIAEAMRDRRRRAERHGHEHERDAADGDPDEPDRGR